MHKYLISVNGSSFSISSSLASVLANSDFQFFKVVNDNKTVFRLDERNIGCFLVVQNESGNHLVRFGGKNYLISFSLYTALSSYFNSTQIIYPVLSKEDASILKKKFCYQHYFKDITQLCKSFELPIVKGLYKNGSPKYFTKKELANSIFDSPYRNQVLYPSRDFNKSLYLEDLGNFIDNIFLRIDNQTIMEDFLDTESSIYDKNVFLRSAQRSMKHGAI